MSFFQPIIRSHPGYIASRRYPLTLGSGSQALAAIDTIYCFCFMLGAPLSFTAFSAYVSTGGAASSMKMGIWADSPVSHRPLGAPLFKDDTGVATATSTTTVDFSTGAGALAPFTHYWAGSKFTGTLPAMFCQAVSTNFSAMQSGIASANNNTASLAFADAFANAMPTFAEAAGFSPSGANVPLIYAVT
jgi:hypothetical protein